MTRTNDKKSRIAFVSPRYGLEVNGGAELYCRLVAERLIKYYHVDVLTTCAIDYVTWKDEYKQGSELINGVNVVRFRVDKERNKKVFDDISVKVLTKDTFNYFNEIEWMEKQGPVSTELLSYLYEHKKNYKAIIFMPYLYATTFFGLQIAPEKSVLIPAAHDERPIYLGIFNSIFHLPKAIMYNTEEEKAFVQKKFSNYNIKNHIVGIGIDIPKFEDAKKIDGDYVVYIGRIDQSKGCDQLFDFFIKYKKNNNCELKLVLIGKSVMDIPRHKDILELGFVSDEEKFQVLKNAKALILSSEFESLSMVVLESMVLEVPVLVNGKCEVLKEHCKKSNAGFYYLDYNEFEVYLNLLLNDAELRNKMGKNGKSYVEKNYIWEVVEDKFLDVIEGEFLNCTKLMEDKCGK